MKEILIIIIFLTISIFETKNEILDQSIIEHIKNTKMTSNVCNKLSTPQYFDQAFSNYTTSLIDLFCSNETSEVLLADLVSLSQYSEIYGSYDLYISSLILDKIVLKAEVVWLDDVTEIVSNIMSSQKIVMYVSQQFHNSSDVILFCYDILQRRSKLDPSFNKYGYYLAQSKHLATLIFDGRRCAVTGLGSTIYAEPFLIFSNVSLAELTGRGDVEIASFIPNLLMEQLIQSSGPLIVSMTIFYSDALFGDRRKNCSNLAKNVGILLPPIQEDFIEAIPILYSRKSTRSLKEMQCGYWLYGAAQHGHWTNDNTSSPLNNTDNFVICQFNHTTHFALLMIGDLWEFEGNLMEMHDGYRAVVMIGSILSICGIAGTFLTAILFPRWRRNKGNQILLHFNAVTSFEIIFLYLSVLVKEDTVDDIRLCVFIGIVLHYSVLSQFCWMLVIAMLQYQRYVIVFYKSRKWILIKSCVIGYVGPMVPVAIVTCLCPETYASAKATLCYPSGYYLIFSLTVPIGMIVLINFIILLIIGYNIFVSKGEEIKIEEHNGVMKLRLIVSLFFILGLNWIFGLLIYVSRMNWVFIFLYTLTTAFQGFVVFTVFIIFNNEVRSMYANKLRIICQSA